MFGEAIIRLAAVCTAGDLQIGNRGRVPHVPLLFGTPVEFAGVRQHRQPVARLRRKPQRVTTQHFFGQHVKIDTLNAAGGSGKATINHFVAEAYGLEDLCTFVRLERRDAHLGHHLEHSLGNTLAIGGEKLVVGLNTGNIEVWDTMTWTRDRTLQGHRDYVRDFAVHEGKLVSGPQDRTIKVWDPASDWACERTLSAFPHKVFCLAVHGDSVFAGMAGDGKTIEVRSFATGEAVRSLEGHSSKIWSLALSGGKLVSASIDTTLKIWA